ncbi:MAG TPA: leucine-rich repeat domain-containing protein, partial [Myxococcota bacterium]|nr:leucine-rich repeat domain-containing protein [Myxococcota bacterium]
EDLNLVDKALEPADLDALLKALSKALEVADELPLRRLDLSRNRIGDRGLELLRRWLSEHAAQLPLLAVVAVANNDAEARTEVQLAVTLSRVHKRAVIEGQFGAHGDERRYQIARRFIDRKNLARAEFAPTPPDVTEGQ